MKTKTLMLAAAAVLSLGVGSAFAEGDGNGNSYYQNQPTQQNEQSVSPRAGQSAGDAVQQYHYIPNWISKNATGGGN